MKNEPVPFEAFGIIDEVIDELIRNRLYKQVHAQLSRELNEAETLVGCMEAMQRLMELLEDDTRINRLPASFLNDRPRQVDALEEGWRALADVATECVPRTVFKIVRNHLH